jgi:hypothetical protein
VCLVCGNGRSLEDRESGMREYALSCLTRGPVFTSHIAIVGRRSAPREAIPLVVGAHAVESAAPRQLSLEVVDVREFDIRPCRLIVIAVLVEPRNGIGA